MSVHGGIAAIISGRAPNRVYIGGGLTAHHHGGQVWEICRDDERILAFVTPMGAHVYQRVLNFGERYTLGHLIHGLTGRRFDWVAWRRSNRLGRNNND